MTFPLPKVALSKAQTAGGRGETALWVVAALLIISLMIWLGAVGLLSTRRQAARARMANEARQTLQYLSFRIRAATPASDGFFERVRQLPGGPETAVLQRVSASPHVQVLATGPELLTPLIPGLIDTFDDLLTDTIEHGSVLITRWDPDPQYIFLHVSFIPWAYRTSSQSLLAGLILLLALVPVLPAHRHLRARIGTWPLRWKLGGLFLLANGFPFWLLLVGGGEFQALKGLDWQNAVRQKAFTVLRNYDQAFLSTASGTPDPTDRRSEGHACRHGWRRETAVSRNASKPTAAGHSQREFLARTLAQVSRHLDGWSLRAIRRATVHHPLETVQATGTRRLLQAARPFLAHLGPIPREAPADIIWKEESCLLFGMAGRHLDRWNLVLIVPRWPLEQGLRETHESWMVLIGINVLMTLLLLNWLTSRVLDPIQALSAGIQALEEGRFGHRIPRRHDSEWGDLAEIFNHLLEDSQDLHVAALVQESLFPHGPLARGSIRVFGKSLALEQLGGDYFDYFVGNDNQLAVIIGDVVGHGVPAALSMAMAKAVVLHRPDLWDQPERLMRLLHDLFQANRPRSMHRFMSLQFLLIDPDDGVISITNAGHPYPIRLLREGGHERLILKSLPLGGAYRPILATTTLTLEPGEVLFLYSDGIAEAKGPDGRLLGYEQIGSFLEEHRHDDPELIWQSVLQAAGGFRDVLRAADDVTMVIVTRRRVGR
jgi:HAMP domain-containing protein